VHRLVADAFLGPIPDEMVVNHKSGDKSDNSVGNLEIVSRRENYDHAVANQLYYRGPRPERSKFTVEDIYFIREAQGNIEARELAERFGVHKYTIQCIWRRKAHAHHPENPLAA